MNIAMVTPYSWAHPGGVNTHVRGLAAEMMRRGHLVTIIAPDRGAAPEGARFIGAGRSLPVPANGSIARLAFLPGTGSRVGRTVREGGFDVVHVHEPLVPSVSTSAVMAAGGRVVGTFHAAGEGRSVAYGFARVYRGVHKRLDSMIAVSESARNLVSGYFPGEYTLIPNGVDLERFHTGHSRPPGFPPADYPVVLFVGRNERRKGLRVLLDAFPRVLEEIPSCHLVIAGEGFKAGSIPGGMRATPAYRVSVLGYVANEDLPAYYEAADAFCAPALGGESFGVVLIESMASGTPVVASDIAGYRDVVETSGGGLLFETGEGASLALKLIELLSNENLRGALREKGIGSAAAYSWSVLGDRIEAIYGGD